MEILEEFQIKYNEVYPSETSMYWAKQHLYDIWPELKEYENSICVISATLGTPTFWKRKVENVAEEIRHEYSLGKKNFIFQCLDEGVPLTNINQIHNVCLLIQDILPEISIIYATGAYNGENIYKDICRTYNLPEIIKVISGYNFEKNSKYFANYVSEYEPGPRIKKFLSFNKEIRQHRLTMFEEMLRLNLVEETYYSFYIEPQTLKRVLMDPSRYPNIIKNKDMLPLALNRSATRNNPADVQADDIKYFNNSYFSVVNETLYYGIVRDTRYLYYNSPEIFGIFPSEKIFKCLGLNHPFIVVSASGFLQALRDKGYKTFAPYIDESYDTITDDIERMDAIVNEINRLCNLSEQELIQFTHDIKGIVEHNSAHLSNTTDFRITENVVNTLK
jgi:hypothetical protein